MSKKGNSMFPKDFFTQPRSTISMKEATKDAIPFEWSQSDLNGESQVKIVSAKNNG